MAAEALFYREGDFFVPTPLTQGPWSPDAQHGGPPAALLAGAIERFPADSEMVVSRLTIELLRPIPLEPLEVTVQMKRPGRRVQLVEAAISHRNRRVASAIGLKIRKADTDVPAAPDEPAPPGREGGRTASFFADVGAYASESSEISVIEGNFNERGPGSAWIRLKGPVIAGQEPTPIERVAAAADFGNGVSSLTGNDRSWLFINPDLTIQLARPPVGEWIHLESRSQMHPSGTGLAVSRLADTEGWLGASAQSLLVDRIRGQQSGSDQ